MVLGEYEALALTHFAFFVGTETFLNSDVFTAIQRYKKINYTNNPIGYAVAKANVLREMQAWTTNGGVVQESMKQMRRFEAVLFQCPDGMDISITQGDVLSGSLNYGELADTLETQLEEYIDGLDR